MRGEVPAAAARVTMDAAISALKAEREKFAADKRRVQKQSAQELAHELSCGNPSHPRNLHEMLPFEKHATRARKQSASARAKNPHAAHPFILRVSLTWPRN